MDEQAIVLTLGDKSFSSIIKKKIKKIAEEAGFYGYRLGELEIIVSELVSNLGKHAVSGERLVIKKICSEENVGLELISIDDGPGISDLTKMITDGVSTTNTLGQGLGAIKRLSDDFDAFSEIGWGTIILCRMFIKKPEPKLKTGKLSTIYSSLLLAKDGFENSGDGFEVIRKPGVLFLLAIDGLGHGEKAKEASDAARKVFMENIRIAPSDMIREIHQEIKKTRGVVGIVCKIDNDKKKMIFCGVGNISAKLISGLKFKSFSSYNGIIGLSLPATLHDTEIDWDQQDMLIINSDGIKSNWDTQRIIKIQKHDPSLINAVIFKDYSRKTDDILVITLKNLRA